MLAEHVGTAADEVGVFHGLLEDSGAAGIPSGTVFRVGIDQVGRGGPEELLIRSHAVEAGVAGGVGGEIDDVDAGDADVRVCRIHREGRGRGCADGGGEVRHREERGDGRAAGVGRDAASRLKGIHEVALAAVEALAVRQGERGRDIPLVPVEVAQTTNDGIAVNIAAAVLGDVERGVGHEALKIAFCDEVDHAADRIGAVDGGGAVFEDFDPLDGGEGNGVEINHAAVEAVGGDATTVEQNEGGVGTLAAKIGRGGTVIAARGTGNDVGLRREVVEAVAVDVEIHDELLGARDAFLLHFELGENGEGQSAFVGDSLDQGAGDGEPFKLRDGLAGGGLGRGGGLGMGGGDQARSDEEHEPCRRSRQGADDHNVEGWCEKTDRYSVTSSRRIAVWASFFLLSQKAS